MEKLEYLSVPLDGITTTLQLPYIIYSSHEYEIVLKELTSSDVERAFRLRIVEDANTGAYHMESTEEYNFYGDDHIQYYLHDSKLQLCVVPKNSILDNTFRERLSLALECALGYFDEHVSWVYEQFASVASRGAYRSHMSMCSKGTFDAKVVAIIRLIISYKDSGELPEHKFETLRALLNSARHQAGAADVACVLYFSVLESVYVQSNQELAYKLSMRMTKKLNKDHAFARKVMDMYSRRGDVIHGTEKGDVFSQEELRLLEGLAKRSFVSFVETPRDFSNTKLDKLLLQ